MNKPSRIGCVGAVIVHPVLILVGFIWGTLFGYPEPQPMSGTSAYGSVDYGIAGGVNAVKDVFVHYVMTLGIAAIIVSIGGAAVAYVLVSITSRISSTFEAKV